MIYNPFPQVELPFGKDNKYFLDLFDSISQVDRKYVEYKVECHDNRYGYAKHLERVFAYELYRHWSNKITSLGSLILNAEINKVIEVNKILTFVDDDTESQEPQMVETVLYPDMVLHHSQGDDTAQILTCEIKRDICLSGSLLLGDIYKLCCYMTQDFFKEGKKPFKYGVFVVVGDSCMSDVFKRLKVNSKIKTNDGNDTYSFSSFIKDEKMSPSFGRIVCVVYDGSVLEYDAFDNLIKNISFDDQNE